MRKVWISVAALSLLLGICLAQTPPAFGQAVPQTAAERLTATPEAAPAPQQPNPLVQVQAVLAVAKAQARAKRLEVLKKLEAGEINAQTALEELDKLPASPAQYSQGNVGNAWLSVTLMQGKGNEINIALPLTVVRWIIGEGPKLLPAEVRREIQSEMGFDVANLDLSVFLVALDVLSHISEPTPLFMLRQNGQEISIVVKPGPVMAN